MGIAGRLAGDRAQPETLRRVERGALDPAVVERDALRLAVFEEQLAVIHAGERLADKLLDAARIHAGAVEKQVVGHGEIGHRRLRFRLSACNSLPQIWSRRAGERKARSSRARPTAAKFAAQQRRLADKMRGRAGAWPELSLRRALV